MQDGRRIKRDAPRASDSLYRFAAQPRLCVADNIVVIAYIQSHFAGDRFGVIDHFVREAIAKGA